MPPGVAEHNVTVARAFTKLMGAFVTFWDSLCREARDEAVAQVASAVDVDVPARTERKRKCSEAPFIGLCGYCRLPSCICDSRRLSSRLAAPMGATSCPGVDLRARVVVPKMPLSGVSTCSGDLARFTFEALDGTMTDVFIHLIAYQLVTLSGTGVSVLD